MPNAESINPGLFSRLVESLYIEAMVMADEARSYFDREGTGAHGSLDTMSRLTFTCESLKVTTRLMHVIAWLLTQKAWQRGEIRKEVLGDSKYRLGPASATEGSVLATMPEAARNLVEGSQSLYDRVARLQQRMLASVEPAAAANPAALVEPVASPARGLLDRLEKAF